MLKFWVALTLVSLGISLTFLPDILNQASSFWQFLCLGGLALFGGVATIREFLKNKN